MCILWQWWVEEIPLQFPLPSVSRFASFDEWDNQCEKWETERQKSDTLRPTIFCLFFRFPFHSFKSKVLSPVLPLCHAYFNYLTGLQRRGREWVSNRCHFSSSRGGHGDCCQVTRGDTPRCELEESNTQTAILPLRRYLKLRNSKSMLASPMLPLCCKELSQMLVNQQVLKILINKTHVITSAPSML